MPQRKFDKRLLGIWQSDRRRTIRDIQWSRNATAAGRRKFAALYGRLIVRYTRTKIYSGFEGETLESKPYEIVATDSDSVAIIYQVDWLVEERIVYIRFEDCDHYWIIGTLGNREWFRRLA